MSANDELAVLRQRLEDETRRRQEAEQQLAALTAPKRKKKKRCILDDSDSDSDGGEDGDAAALRRVSQSPPRQLVKKRRTILEDDDLFAFRRVDPDALSRRESNAFVQKVLDAHRFGFTLLDHQYEAARCVAGLPYLWPRTLVNDRADDTLEQAPLTADRHLILADQMGLGKTVTTLAGAVLRRAIAAFHSRHAPKAVLVITPNAAVMHQWSEHIDRAHGLVHVYGGGGARDGKLKARLELYEKEAARGGEVRTLVVLTTKYAVQSAAMDACNFSSPKPCALFPHLSRKDLMKLGLLKFAAADAERFLRMVDGGKLGEAGQHVADLQLEKNGKHDESALIRDIIAAARPQRDEDLIFDGVYVDEAHEIKNPATWWALAAAAAGNQSRRGVLITGTPVQNNLKELAGLISNGDATDARASPEWWRDATWDKYADRPRSNAEIERRTRDWRIFPREDGDRPGETRPRHFEMRLKGDVLRLPPKTQSRVTFELAAAIDASKIKDAAAAIAANMKAQPAQFAAYAEEERCAVRMFREFAAAMKSLEHGPKTPQKKADAARLMKMWCCSANDAKTSLVHPLIPGGGRTLTCHFVDRRYRHDKCVLCFSHDRAERAGEYITSAINDGLMGPPVWGAKQDPGLVKKLVARLDATDDELAGGDDLADDVPTSDQPECEDTDGPLLELPQPFCAMKHMGCKGCVDQLRRAGKLHLRGGCPLCDDLLKRSKMGMAPAGAPQKLYCTDVLGGFASTAKLERGKAEIEETCGKRGEKSIFFSCSKATLDLFEALTTHHIQGVAAYRYDGDIDASERRKVLARFKKHAGGAVLFATVQTAGVGCGAKIKSSRRV